MSYKVYFKNKNGVWQHAHTFKNSVKGKIQAHNAAKRINEPTKITHNGKEFI